MMDMTATLFQVTYGVFGRLASLTPAGGAALEVTVQDRTKGLELSDLNTGTFGVMPAVLVRAAEIETLAIGHDTLRGGLLVLDGASWTVDSYQERPSSFGPQDGQIVLILSEGAPGAG